MINLIKIDTDYDLNYRESFLKNNNLPDENGVLITTCDRVEFYYGFGEIKEDIINHLFRLTAGLESKLIGELAIQGQVKDAYLNAKNKYPLSPEMHKLFQTALSVGKKARNQTDISKGAMSHSHIVIEILKKKNIDLKNKNITIIGINKINRIILEYLNRLKCKTILLANRTFEKACRLATEYNCKALNLSNIKKSLPDTDILISSTSAPHLIVKYEDFPINKNMIIFDMAVPRDIDYKIKDLPSVELYNIEDIEKHINQNIDQRADAVKSAELIIENELKKFIISLSTLSLSRLKMNKS